jgi:leucyl aminopeptidase
MTMNRQRLELSFHPQDVSAQLCPAVDALVLLCAPDREADPLVERAPIRALDEAVAGRLSRRVARRRFRGKLGQQLRLDPGDALAAEELILLGIGTRHPTPARWLSVGQRLGGLGRSERLRSLAVQLATGEDTALPEPLVRGLMLGRYEFARYRKTDLAGADDPGLDPEPETDAHSPCPDADRPRPTPGSATSAEKTAGPDDPAGDSDGLGDDSDGDPADDDAGVDERGRWSRLVFHGFTAPAAQAPAAQAPAAQAPAAQAPAAQAPAAQAPAAQAPAAGPPSAWLDEEPLHQQIAAVNLCRDLVNEPAAAATPTALAERARALVELGVEVRVLDRQACESRGMGLFAGVARGSREPPAFIHAIHRPPTGAAAPADAEAAAPPRVALVGKGITFDSGGLSLKTSAGMKDMKSDMAGGAVVLAVMQQLAAAALALEVHGIVPACENMPSDRSVKLGDVLQGLDGPSVEIVNTDAEGRLVLADALAYARQQGCDVLVDVATLTGACVVALGEQTAGLFANDEPLAEQMLEAAHRSGEPLWRLPLTKTLTEQLKSSVADCKNAGGRWGGAITAALFLEQFVGKARWLHLDIAGPAYRAKGGSGRPAGATGYGVATLYTFLQTLATDGPRPGSEAINPDE